MLPMNKNLTLEKLVLFVYDEISDPEEREEISRMMKENNDIYTLYNELFETRDSIKDSFSSPSENSIQRILNYSKALSVVHTKDHHTMGLVLN